jgi:CheY-like chemotaxis protein
MTPVLLVDDDQAIRETLRLVLEDAGYQVQEASDGIAALQALRDAPNGMVVLLDLMMPKLDGAGVLGAVAGDRRLAKRHTFILTTATHQTLSLAFVNLLTNLAVPVVRKPFELDELLAIVERAAQRL